MSGWVIVLAGVSAFVLLAGKDGDELAAKGRLQLRKFQSLLDQAKATGAQSEGDDAPAPAPAENEVG